MLRILGVLLICIMMGAGVPAAKASEEGPALPQLHWHFDGAFGTYDKGALQRGYKVYREVCASCHSMKRVYFRNLSDLGYSDAEIKAIAAEYTVTDGPDDEGEMYQRPARPSDPFVLPYPNRKAAMYANNGAFPPDMSLLAKARHGGADYIYGILNGYTEPPHDKELLPGQYWNKYMQGHVIAMAPPLMDGQVSYEDGTPETVSQYAMDVAEFLTWASEPHMKDRKYTGFKAFLFLLVFSIVMYNVKKKTWADLH